MKRYIFTIVLFWAVFSGLAQDYKISFAGTGSSTTIETVKIENLTQGKSLTINGSDVLLLVATITGINPEIDNNQNNLQIYPNPSSGNCKIDFVTHIDEITTFEIFDIAGKLISGLKNDLGAGNHSFNIVGLTKGIYLIKISSKSHIYTGKLVSNSVAASEVKIAYNGNSENIKILKSTTAEKPMQYTIGDRLKITGKSGNFSTIIIDIPTQSKTIMFTFTPCTDADGNNYSVVQIGTQTWMAENLKTTKYRNGATIPNITSNTDWANLYHVSAYCWYNNDSAANKDTYGALYNWETAVNNNIIAPTGWHVPTQAEWTALITYLGGESVAGGKLKDISTILWASPNLGASNSTGFNAIPAGERTGFVGTFGEINNVGHWWSSTRSDIGYDYAWYYSLYHDYEQISSASANYHLGLSIRCIKD